LLDPLFCWASKPKKSEEKFNALTNMATRDLVERPQALTLVSFVADAAFQGVINVVRTPGLANRIPTTFDIMHTTDNDTSDISPVSAIGYFSVHRTENEMMSPIDVAAYSEEPPEMRFHHSIRPHAPLHLRDSDDMEIRYVLKVSLNSVLQAPANVDVSLQGVLEIHSPCRRRCKRDVSFALEDAALQSQTSVPCAALVQDEDFISLQSCSRMQQFGSVKWTSGFASRTSTNVGSYQDPPLEFLRCETWSGSVGCNCPSMSESEICSSCA
jgi:hypothetical protein